MLRHFNTPLDLAALMDRLRAAQAGAGFDLCAHVAAVESRDGPAPMDLTRHLTARQPIHVLHGSCERQRRRQRTADVLGGV